MATKVKAGGKILIGVLIIAAVIAVKYLFVDSELLIKKDVKQLAEISSVILPDAPKTITGETVKPLPLPTDALANVNSPLITLEIMAWNAQIGMIYANGGIKTTKCSLMEKNGVNLYLKRQDDCNQMQLNMIKFANDYKNSPSTATGTNLIIIMGDGAASWLAGINKELVKLGKEYTAQIFFTVGHSQGEDKFMASQEVKDNPQKAKGAVCAAVERDGDWNIVIKWCSDNNIRINTDDKCYDPDGMNFVAANDYLDAAAKYITGYTETRDVITVDSKTGKTIKTGEKKPIKVNCVTTWTPGDVNIAEQKGGLVSIVSTFEHKCLLL
jgi:OmpA-OmpF porin, OOP family